MTGTQAPTSTDVAVRDTPAPAAALPALPDTDNWIRAMSSIAKLANEICGTSFVPKAYRNDPAAVTAAILTGRELDMPPMTALRHVHIVEGVPSLDAEYKRSRVLAQGHEFRILEWDNRHCKVSARRKGDRGEPLVMEYTIDDARRAGLVKDRGNYVTRPKVMMLARVTTLVCNAIFADVTNGLATTEEVVDDIVQGEVVTDPPAIPARPSGAEIRADRAQRQQPETEAAAAVPADVNGGQPADPTASGPSGSAAPDGPPPPTSQSSTGSAGGSGSTPPDTADAPGSERHRRKLKAAVAQARKLFGDNQAERLAAAAKILRTEVLSFGDLTADELETVARAFSQHETAADLYEALQHAEVPGA